MNKIKLLIVSLVCSSMILVGCGKKAASESVEPESVITETTSSGEESISYTCEEAINAVAASLGQFTSSGNPTKVTDYSDEEGPYFVTGIAFAASGVTTEQLKGIVPECMPDGFELVQDWADATFSDSTPYEGCFYLCEDVVLGNAVYASNISGTDVVVLQVSCYSIA